MHEFMPLPERSSRWWQEQRIAKNILAIPEEVSCPEALSERSWIGWADHGKDKPSVLGGCYALVFLTVADCLLWLRWHALPYMRRSIRSGGQIVAAMEEIDRAPAGSGAEKLLQSLTARLVGEHVPVAQWTFHSRRLQSSD